jgi:type I restriction-modification system DNA methylase subunit
MSSMGSIKGRLSRGTDLLQEVYVGLDLNNGDLVQVEETANLKDREFVDKSQWLDLCRYISRDESFKAEAVFFVENNPIIVFVRGTEADRERLHEVFNRVWCMANPRFLFISTPTELSVYDLASRPARELKELTPLETVEKVVEIASKLKIFKRESIESGDVFGDERFGKIDSRADQALIGDIKTLRKLLFDKGLDGDKLKYAHALIGRSIFIRYLEDRGILTKEYFYGAAGDNPKWKGILEEKPAKPPLYREMKDLFYLKVLSNIDFTYHLYNKLSEDFNGDMFPTDQNEREAVTRDHLFLLQQFLKGEGQEQANLFFWAYRFDIIPIELISNIYEELYHYEDLKEGTPGTKTGGKGSHGTHYTPASLVEFLLSRVLTVEILEKNPRVIDPACGSGIFLVETFRRIVRFELFRTKQKSLSFSHLEQILQEQIGGIELNPEAVRIAAFSLYLAFLHYQEPPDILHQVGQGNKLPNLIYTDKKKAGKKYFDILIHANAFEIDKAVGDQKVREKFLSDCADVVVGNPPWGKVSIDDIKERQILNSIETWCKNRQKYLPDLERSQGFIWRAIDLLKNNGSAALLVSSGVLLKTSNSNNRCKQNLFRSIYLKEVVNFVHTRDVFFNGAISPFISIFFKKEIPNPNARIDYWTARRTKVIENTKTVVLDKSDFKFFKYSDTVENDIWKIYYFGNHRDRSLLSGIRLYPTFRVFEMKGMKRRQGFKESRKGKKDSGWLKNYRFFPQADLNRRYGDVDISTKLKPVPDEVREKGTPEIYEGMRILMKRGPAPNDYGKDGYIIARLYTETFAFKHSINCIKLHSNKEEDYKILLGIFWSSLLRYYFFMTSSSWPIWHDQIYLEEILNMPVTFPRDEKLKKRIVHVVDELRIYKPKALGSEKELRKLEEKLDDAIFELYMLTEAEADLVRDRCKFDIDFYYNPSTDYEDYEKLTSGTYRSIPPDRDKQKGLESYIHVFLKSWNPEVEEGKELNWQVVHHPAVSMIALIFTLVDKGKEAGNSISPGELPEWRDVLSKIEKETRIKYSSRVYIEGIVRVVTKDSVIIIKRDEERLWTRSAAYEDAEATLLQAMEKEKQSNA